MKKLIAIIAGFVFVVVLACAALILFDPFSGVKVKGDILEDDDIQDLKEDLKSFFEDNYSYEFKYKEEKLQRFEDKSRDYKSTSKGLVSIEYYDAEKTSTMSFDVSSKVSSKIIESSMNGKKVYKDTYDEEVIRIAGDITRENSEDEYFVSAKNSSKKNKSKETTSFKTQASDNHAHVPELESILLGNLDSSDAFVYQNDDKYTIIISTSDSFTEVKFTFDGRDLTKVTVKYENTDGGYELKIKVCEFEEIDEPKDSREYQPLPHEHKYLIQTDKCSCGELNPEHDHSYNWDGYCRCGDYNPSYAYK